ASNRSRHDAASSSNTFRKCRRVPLGADFPERGARMKILTAAQMRAIDRITIEELGMPSLTLMENAGLRFVEVLESRFAPVARQRITILCGQGNNGGD